LFAFAVQAEQGSVGEITFGSLRSVSESSSSKLDRNSEIVQSVANAYRSALGEEPKEVYVDYTIDAGYMNMNGIPTIMLGAVDMRFAHGDTEFTNLNDTYDVARIYANWAITNAR